MWKDKIKEIIYMLENSDVNEIEVRFWFKKIKVTKKPAILNVDSKQLSFDNQNIPNLVKEQPINQSSEASKDIPETKLIEIKSPMPGTFYSAPDPESPSFVNIGDNTNNADSDGDRNGYILVIDKKINVIKKKISYYYKILIFMYN